MTWEDSPQHKPRRAVLVVVALVAVGAAIAVVGPTGSEADPDQLPVEADADADDEASTGEDDPEADERGANEPETDEVDPQAGPDGVEGEPVPSEELETSATLPGETGLELLFTTGRQEVTSVDLDTGQTRTLELEHSHDSPMGQEGLVLHGDVVLLLDHQHVVALPADLSGEPRLLGEGQFALAGEPGEAWLLAQSGPYETQAKRVAVDDGATLAEHSLPSARVVGAHAGELLLLHHGRLLLYDPERGDGREIGFGNFATATAEWFAWLDCRPDLSCGLAVERFDGTESRRVDIDPGPVQGWLPHTLSPSGDHLVVPRWDQSSAVIIDTVLATEHELDVEVHDRFSGGAWAPDGSWYLVSYGRAGEILAWRAEDGEQVVLDLGLNQPITGLAVR